MPYILSIGIFIAAFLVNQTGAFVCFKCRTRTGQWLSTLNQFSLTQLHTVSYYSTEELKALLEADELLLDKYDPEIIDRYFDKRPLVVWERLVDIGGPVLSWWLTTKYDNITAPFRSERENEELITRRAEELKDAIVQGQSITFIKSGQALSLRPDILKSPEYVRELTKLQDEVGTFPNDVAMQIITDELGKNATDVFEFDPPDPIASASIGQVYRARLKDVPSSPLVAVKVQRPDAVRTVAVDMFILRKLAAFLKARRKLRSNLVGIADEFGYQLYGELNYEQEANNCRKFKQLYGKIPDIYVPATYPAFTKRRVLTMEFVNGTKGPWPENGERMLTVGLQCSVLQLLGTGFFHSDPHRGNLMQTNAQQLAYLDFGMMTEVSAKKRYALIGAALGLVNQDLELVITCMNDLEFFGEGTNVTNVVSVLSQALLSAQTESGRASSLNFTQLNANLQKVQDQLPFQIPPYYTMIVRSLTILEGLALSVDPSFRLIRGAYPFIARQILSPVTSMSSDDAMTNAKTAESKRELTRLLRRILLDEKTGRIRWSKLEKLLSVSQKAERALTEGDFAALQDAQTQSDVLRAFGHQRRDEADPARSTSRSRMNSGDSSSANDAGVTIDLEMATLMLNYLSSDAGSYLREPLYEEVLATLETLARTTQQSLSVLTRGLVPSTRKELTSADRALVLRLASFVQSLLVSGGSITAASSPTESSATSAGNSRVTVLRRVWQVLFATALEANSRSGRDDVTSSNSETIRSLSKGTLWFCHEIHFLLELSLSLTSLCAFL